MFNRFLDIMINNPDRNAIDNQRAGPTPQHSTPPTLHRRRLFANKRMLVLLVLILLPVLAGCTRNIGSQSDGWNPPFSSDGVVYVATKDG